MFKRFSRVLMLLAAILPASTPAFAATPGRAPAYDDYSRQVLQDGPVGYWRLNDAAGSTTALDFSGNGNNATVGANVTMGAPSVLAHETASQAQMPTNGGALTTSKTSDLIVTPASAALQPTTAMTVEALITLPGSLPPGNNNLVAVGQGFIASSPYTNYGIGCHTTSNQNNICQPYATVNGATINLYGGLAGISGGTTFLETMTWDGTNVNLYINGGLVATTPKSGPITYPSVIGTSIGGGDANGGGNQEMPIKVGEVAIYPTALPIARIIAHANAMRGLPTYTAAQLATTTVPGTTQGKTRQLVWSDISGTAQASWTNTQWQYMANHIDENGRTYYTPSVFQGMVSHGILPGAYLDGSRSQTPNATYNTSSAPNCSQGGAACANQLRPTSILRTCDGVSPIYFNGTMDAHNTVNDYTSSTLAQDLNTGFVNSLATQRGGFVNYDNVFMLPDMTNYFNGSTLITSGGLPFPSTPALAATSQLGITGPTAVSYNQALGYPATNAAPTCVANPLAPAIANPLLPPTLYTPTAWAQGIGNTFQNLNLPVMFNFLTSYVSQLAPYVMTQPNVMGAWKENLYNGKSSPPQWNLAENLENTVLKYNKQFTDFEHLYAETASNDMQGYMLASHMLMYTDGLSAFQVDGGTVGNTGAATTPAQNIVALNPEIPTSQIRSIDDLLVGTVYVRRYRDVYINGTSVGACAFIVNADRYNPSAMPAFTTTYTQSVTLNNSVGFNSNKGAITEMGDTGTIGEAATTTPTSLAASGWYIACQ